MKTAKTLLCILLIALLSLSIAGCGGNGSSTQSSSSSTNSSSSSSNSSNSSSSSTASGNSGGITVDTDEFVSYTLGHAGAFGRFYAGLTPTEHHSSADAVFDVIFRADPTTKEIFSWCLESWEWIDDVTFNMKLREDVYFNNGVQAKSNDLLYSYTSYADRGASTFETWGIVWEECKTLDDYTVQMKFEETYPPFLYTIVYLINEEWCRRVGWESLEWLNNPVGSGPYRVVEYSTDQRVVLQAVDNWWNKDAGPIYVDEWIVKNYPDSATMFMDLEVGNIDFCQVNAADYSRYLREGGNGYEVAVESIGTTLMCYMGYLDNPGWYDKRVREAMAYGVEWDEIGKIQYGDLYKPSWSVATTACPYYINPGTYEYDPDRSRALMIEAGYGPDNPFKIVTTMTDTDKAALEAIQYYMAQFYIDFTINITDGATAIAIWRSPGGSDLAIWRAHRGSPNHEIRAGMTYVAHRLVDTFSYIDHERFQELYYILGHTLDEDVLRSANTEIQQLIYDEVLAIPISECMYSMGYRTDRFISEEQLKSICTTGSIIQLSRLGLLSTWQ